MDPQCRLSIHQFTGNVMDHIIHYYVLNLKDSLFLWIGQSAQIKNLAMAMMTKYNNATATGTNIMGDFSDTTSKVLAQKLATRMKKQVYVSFNIDTVPGGMNLQLIEKRIIEELSSQPDKFGCV